MVLRKDARSVPIQIVIDILHSRERQYLSVHVKGDMNQQCEVKENEHESLCLIRVHKMSQQSLGTSLSMTLCPNTSQQHISIVNKIRIVQEISFIPMTQRNIGFPFSTSVVSTNKTACPTVIFGPGQPYNSRFIPLLPVLKATE